MPSLRQPMPPHPVAQNPQLTTLLERAFAASDFEKAVEAQAMINAQGSGPMPEDQGAAEAAVIASGRSRPPEDWFDDLTVLKDWLEKTDRRR